MTAAELRELARAAARTTSLRWEPGDYRSERETIADAVLLAIEGAVRESALERVVELEKQVKDLRRQLAFQSENNHRRNLELDALHYVWCDGGCKGGVHRWTDETVTRELVDAAVRNTQRLVSWFENRAHREARALIRGAKPGGGTP